MDVDKATYNLEQREYYLSITSNSQMMDNTMPFVQKWKSSMSCCNEEYVIWTMQLPNKSINDITRQQLYHISGSYYIPSIQENQACFLHNCTFLSCSYFCGVGSQISNLVYPWFESSPSKLCSLSHSILNPSLKSLPALEISWSKSEVGPWSSWLSYS